MSDLIKPSNTVKVLKRKVLDAYFAEKKIEKVAGADTKEDYTVKAKDTLSKIAKKKGTTVKAIIALNDKITEANKHLIRVGQKIKLTKKSTQKKVTFKRINSANLGQEVYVIVKTDKLQDELVQLNVKQGKAKGIAEKGKAIWLQQDGKEVKIAQDYVGKFACDDETISNKDDFKDWAIIKIKLGSKDSKKQKKETDALEKLTNKKTSLFLLISVTCQDGTPVIYNGRNPDKNGEPDPRTTPNYWLDMDDKWFEVSINKCYCGRDLTVKEVKKIINKDKLFSHKKCLLPKNVRNYKDFTKQLNATLKKYKINTCLRKAHFIAQIEAESDHFNTTIEYADGLDYDHSTHKDDYDNYKLYLSDKKKYKKYKTVAKRGYYRYKECIKHGHNVKGYGAKYKGKGLIQLTWKDTYEKYFNYLGKSTFISTPEKVANDIVYSFDSAGWYWVNGSAWGNMNTKADKDDLIAISIGINGGLNGYKHRKKNIKKILKEMKVSENCSKTKNIKIGIYKYKTSNIKNSKYGKKEKNKTAIKSFDD